MCHDLKCPYYYTYFSRSSKGLLLLNLCPSSCSLQKEERKTSPARTCNYCSPHEQQPGHKMIPIYIYLG